MSSQHYLLSVTGKDRPGIIAKVTGVLFRFDINLEDISMTILEGEFAMMLIVAIPGQRDFKAVAKGIQTAVKPWSLHLDWQPLRRRLKRGERHSRTSQSCMLNVIGPDRTGIIYPISRLLAQNGINITDLNSRILGEGKKAVYASNFEIDIPKRIPLTRLESKLRKLATGLKMDLSLAPVEAILF
ncbi:MAG: ACT domain-containing protein [Candidatus Omnitrophica bacterium]|nr:ACT domain-containing protein [Candidatus Omnitrophota bacterium]